VCCSAGDDVLWLLCLLEVPEVSEVMRCVLRMLEPAKGGFCLLEMMRCVLLCILEVVEGRFYLLEVLEALEVPEMMCCGYSVCRRCRR